MKQLTPILLGVLATVFLGVNGWWAMQWSGLSEAVTANRIAIAEIKSTRYTEANGARGHAVIAELQRQVAELREKR